MAFITLLTDFLTLFAPVSSSQQFRTVCQVDTRPFFPYLIKNIRDYLERNKEDRKTAKVCTGIIENAFINIRGKLRMLLSRRNIKTALEKLKITKVGQASYSKSYK